MSNALMIIAATGDYETAKLLLEELNMPVDDRCYRISLNDFVGKTNQEKAELLVALEKKLDITFGKEAMDMIQDDENMKAFIESDANLRQEYY